MTNEWNGDWESEWKREFVSKCVCKWKRVNKWLIFGVKYKVINKVSTSPTTHKRSVLISRQCFFPPQRLPEKLAGQVFVFFLLPRLREHNTTFSHWSRCDGPSAPAFVVFVPSLPLYKSSPSLIASLPHVPCGPRCSGFSHDFAPYSNFSWTKSCFLSLLASRYFFSSFSPSPLPLLVFLFLHHHLILSS